MEERDQAPSAAHRRDLIVQLLLDQDSVTVKELTERFQVSTMTAHRDLDALAGRGVLRKVRGRRRGRRRCASRD